jgi:hypothetical protein
MDIRKETASGARTERAERKKVRALARVRSGIVAAKARVWAAIKSAREIRSPRAEDLKNWQKKDYRIGRLASNSI